MLTKSCVQTRVKDPGTHPGPKSDPWAGLGSKMGPKTAIFGQNYSIGRTTTKWRSPLKLKGGGTFFSSLFIAFLCHLGQTWRSTVYLRSVVHCRFLNFFADFFFQVRQEFINVYSELNDIRIQTTKYCTEVGGKALPDSKCQNLTEDICQKLSQKFGFKITPNEMSDCHWVGNPDNKKAKVIIKWIHRHESSAFG